MAAIAQGPTVVAIDTKSADFRAYGSGIISGQACGIEPDSAVVAVGYGTDEDLGLEYYLIQNSWGTDWGEGGYVRIEIGAEDDPGTCGIQLIGGASPVVPGPATPEDIDLNNSEEVNPDETQAPEPPSPVNDTDG